MNLCLFILIPFFGGIFCWLFDNKKYQLAKLYALFSMFLTFLLSIFFCYKDFFCTSSLYYFKEEFIVAWIPFLGIHFHLMLDGLSLIMIILSTLLGVVAIFFSKYSSKKNPGLFYLNFLFIFLGAIGIFLSADLFLFFCFWEMMLIPIYFCVIFWGNSEYNKQEKIDTVNQFLIYTQISSMCMLFSILILVFNGYNYINYLTFDYNQLITIPISIFYEYLVMLGFFIAFAVKMPIFPFQNWVPNLHSKLPIDGSIDICGMMIKVALYGFLRFHMIFFRHELHFFFPVAVLLGIITIFYSSVMAFSEKNVKKIISYSSISHMGFLLVALYCGNIFSFYGVVIQILCYSLSTSMLFILFSKIYFNFRTTNINRFGGIYSHIKWIPSLFLFFLFVNLNFPGTLSFVGELIILLSIFSNSPPIAYILIFSLLFSVIYSLNILHKIFYGKYKNMKINTITQINHCEVFLIFSLSIIIIYFGLFPKYIIKMIHIFNT
ncbi:complex I subunit 4 family protein [Buchnera aphidicola]|uniref:complex I subunit 4 family protein n=1 Tax=Buchnera aphidicola TaxID=9 RepID=UPI0031B8B154